MPEPHQLSLEQRAEFSGPTLIEFMEACGDWKLDEKEELSLAGYPDPKEYEIWCEKAVSDAPIVLDESRLLRLGAVVGVSDALARLFPNPADRIHWLLNPSRGPICRGLSPIEMLSDPEDIHVLTFRKKIDDWIENPILKGIKLKRSR